MIISSNKANAKFLCPYCFSSVSDGRGNLAAGLICNHTRMEFFDGKYKIPILSPYNIAILYRKTTELALIEVFVILRMRVTTDEVTYINRLSGIIAKPKVYRQVASIRSVCNKKTTHSYNLVLMVVLLTACLKTKNLIHFVMIFLLYFLMNSSAVFWSFEESGSSPAFSRTRISVSIPLFIMSSKTL